MVQRTSSPVKTLRVEIRHEPFDPWMEVGRHQGAPSTAGSYGATSVFVGTMRDFNEDEQIRAMTLEHYPGMTERHLRRICDDAGSRWPLLDVLLLHRIGRIYPGEAIVLVAVWSAHRAEAYKANRFIMEDLKSKAPFWKKETLQKGDRWVTQNTPG